MGLFGGKTGSGILGVDVGASAIKLVELVREGGRVRLRTYGFTEVPSSEAAQDPREAAERMGVVLKELWRQSGAKAGSVVASLPTFSVFSSIITLPELPKKELGDAIRWEAKKLIPLPVEEMILNWELLPEAPPGMGKGQAAPAKTTGDVTPTAVDVVSEKEKKHIVVLITAAEKKLVERYVAIFKTAGLALQSLETEAFALVRSLVGNDKSTTLIVDIGARNTDISLIDGGIPVLNRSMQFGGATLTDAIARITKLPPRTAEQVKRDAARGVGLQLFTSLTPVLAPLVNELQYTLGLTQARSHGQVAKIILTGGSGFLGDLAPFLSSRFNMTVTVGDPWARVATPLDLQPVLAEIGPRMSVAVGLAMRNI